jgi:hypothetical protein
LFNAIWLRVAVSLTAIASPTSAARDARSVVDLVRQSDYIGMVLADPTVTAPSGPWRQSVYVVRHVSIKGRLTRDPQWNNQYPWVFANRSPAGYYPTSFGEMGWYLVFLGPGTRDGRPVTATLAAFPVLYRPAGHGAIKGIVGVGWVQPNGLPIERVTELLRIVVAAKGSPASAVCELDALFGKIARTHDVDAPPSREERLEAAREIASRVTVGTTRADVEKIFPKQDGGISGPFSSRYYLGAEVMVEVPFDTAGGNWKRTNRVSGQPKAYRSYFSAD